MSAHSPLPQPDDDDRELDAIRRELDELFSQSASPDGRHLPEFLSDDDDLDDPAASPLTASESRKVAYISRQLRETISSAKAAPLRPGDTEADLCDYYISTHQPTVYAQGRFWRQPHPKRPWVEVPADQIAAELLTVLHARQHQAPAPTRHRLRSAFDLLRHRLGQIVEPGQWDNTAGYVLLRDRALPFTGSLHDALEYDQLPFIATTLPYAYDALAVCPDWDAFLEANLPHAAGFVQEFAGYCLTHYTHHALSLWVYGPPHSGVATLLHGFEVLLGPFAGRLSLPDLAQRRLEPASVAGKRLLIAAEAPPDLPALPELAHLEAGTPFHLVPARGQPVTVQSQAKLILAFSSPPSLAARTASLYRRAALLLLPPHAPHHTDARLHERLADQAPGIFMWALRGWNRLVQRGHFERAASLQPPLTPGDFLAHCCLRDPTARTQSSVLYAAYVAWCQAQGTTPLSVKAIAAEWKRLGLQRVSPNGTAFWCGLRLQPHALPPASLLSPATASDNTQLVRAHESDHG